MWMNAGRYDTDRNTTVQYMLFFVDISVIKTSWSISDKPYTTDIQLNMYLMNTEGTDGNFWNVV
jgi:hypothetical protein